MKLFILTLTALFLIASGTPAYSLDTGTIVGEGARSCKIFAKGSKRKKNNFIIWVQGYFSAYNSIAPDIANVAGSHDYFWISDKLETFCKANPDLYFNDAVVALLRELHPKGIKLGNSLSLKIVSDPAE